MKRSRKSIGCTPTQKTTLLNYFQRSCVKLENSTSASTGTSLVDEKILPPPSTARASVINTLATPCRSRYDATNLECPGCNKFVPAYRLNEHLDDECVTSLKKPKRASPTTAGKSSTVYNIDLNTLKTPPKNRRGKKKAQSSSKINATRKKEIAEQFPGRKSGTDVKKYASLMQPEPSDDIVSVRKKLFADDIKPKHTAMPYYLETFLFLLKSTFDEPLHQHLLVEEDNEIYKVFRSLSLDAKKLYVRLFSRKFQWRRKEKIVYEDIAADLTPALNELCASSLLIGVDQLQDLPLLLTLLNQPEMKLLFREVKLPFNGKANAVETFMKHCRNQPCAMGSSQSMTDRMIIKIKRQYVKEAYKLNEEPRRIFLRLLMLSTLHQRQEEEEEKGQQQHSFNMLQVIIGQKAYPAYRIKRQRPIFKKREHFLSYGEAILLELKIRDPFERKHWQVVVDMTDEIQHRTFPEHFKNCQHDLDLPLFLRRLTAGSVYVYIFNKRLEALQTLKKYQEAVDLLSMLVKQDVYLLTHRGHWYERLALNVEQHLKDPLKALDIIKNGLDDTWVSPSHRLTLSQRATRICQSPKLKLEALLKELPLLVPSEPRCVTITGRSLPSELGRKSVFIRGDSQVNMEDGDVTLCSVEELVLQHYIENGYTQGIHGEGSTLWTVIGLLFWDIIYLTEVADVFLSPFQAMPLDFDSLDFYRARQEEIERRLESLRNWSSDELVEWIGEMWNNNHGQTSLVSWDRFRDLDQMNGLVRCISPHSLAAISDRLLRNYRHYRSGFPDLIVWNPQEKKWRVVEVKSPNDRLSAKQVLWLDFLVSLGVEAEVCHVQAVGTKRMGATPYVKSNATKTTRTTSEKEQQVDKGRKRSKRQKVDRAQSLQNEDSDFETI